jgi:predicted O-linked N-acetylglucosamine transferase (SPINDLY family)
VPRGGSRIAALHRQEKWQALATECKRRLAKVPNDLEAHSNLGFALYRGGSFEEAQHAFRAALQVYPDEVDILSNMANMLVERSLPVEALQLAERVCKLRPDHVVPWLLKGMSLHQLWRHEEGLAAAEKAVALAESPVRLADALNLRAIHRRELGDTAGAIEDCELVIKMRPDDSRYRGNLMLFLLSDPSLTPTKLAAAGREHGAATEAAVRVNRRYDDKCVDRNPSRKLRIGFLSPDFRVHAVMHFLEPLLARLDREQFEVWSLYLMHQEDQVTERARQLSDHFLSLAGLSLEESIQKVRSLDLDIVIELAGHSANNGLPMLAARVAPVQASWLGFPATTGMSSVQYRLTDFMTDPQGADGWYTEKLVRMNGFFCCYRPMIRRPLFRYQEAYAVQPTPAKRNGFVTFGTCNNLSKLTDDVLRTWARVLAQVPGSKLLIEGKDLGREDFAAKFTARCERVGISADRLRLVNLDPKNQYLTYHDIDIALDPFPLTGGTTSCDALWMGVPMVTLEGEMFSSRMGVGLLTSMGKPEWIARDVDDYVSVAARLAEDHEALDRIRMTVRPLMEGSPVMNEALHAREFGTALRRMWQEWLGSAKQETMSDLWKRTQEPHRVDTQADMARAESEHTPGETIQVVTQRSGRVSLHQAYRELDEVLARAKATPPSHLPEQHDRLKSEWRAAAEEAKLLMATLPGDPMALAVLAEVELAHGNPVAAEHYMEWAVRGLAAHEAVC